MHMVQINYEGEIKYDFKSKLKFYVNNPTHCCDLYRKNVNNLLQFEKGAFELKNKFTYIAEKF